MWVANKLSANRYHKAAGLAFCIRCELNVRAARLLGPRGFRVVDLPRRLAGLSFCARNTASPCPALPREFRSVTPGLIGLLRGVLRSPSARTRANARATIAVSVPP